MILDKLTDDGLWADESEFEASAKKEKGCAAGAKFKREKDGSEFLGKLGDMPEYKEIAFSQSKESQGVTCEVGKEALATLMYLIFGMITQSFRTPKFLLVMLQVRNEYTWDDRRVQQLMDAINFNRARQGEKERTHVVWFLSQMVHGYKDLADAKVRDVSFGDYIATHSAPPEQINGRNGGLVPLVGLLEVLAFAQVIGDTDVLGGSFANTGFAYEQDANGKEIARIVKIDAGASFNFEQPLSAFDLKKFWERDPEGCRAFRLPPDRLRDVRDVQYGNQSVHNLEWVKLSKEQKSKIQECIVLAQELHGITPKLLDIIANGHGIQHEAEHDLRGFVAIADKKYLKRCAQNIKEQLERFSM